MKSYPLSRLLFAALLFAGTAASARSISNGIEIGSPPMLPSSLSEVAPQTGEEPSALPGGFIPGVSKLYGPINRDTNLGLGGTGGSITAPAVFAPASDSGTHLDFDPSNGYAQLDEGTSLFSGPMLNGSFTTTAVPESGTTSVLLLLGFAALLAARKPLLAKTSL